MQMGIFCEFLVSSYLPSYRRSRGPFSTKNEKIGKLRNGAKINSFLVNDGLSDCNNCNILLFLEFSKFVSLILCSAINAHVFCTLYKWVIVAGIPFGNTNNEWDSYNDFSLIILNFSKL